MFDWPDVIRNWGTTSAERALPFPCDSVLPGFNVVYFRGVTIEAPASVVFRWLCQLRVAPYSYDWIDNVGRRSPGELIAGLDELAIGQPVMRIFDLASFERDRHLTLRLRRPGVFPPLAVSYVVGAATQRRSRLLVKLVLQTQSGVLDSVATTFLGGGDWIMMRRQLLNLKQHAEATYGEGR